MTNKSPYEQIEKLVEAGKRANQKHWIDVRAYGSVSKCLNYPRIEIYCKNARDNRCASPAKNECLEFMKLAANSRQDIENMLNEHRRIEKIKSQVDVEDLREALELYNKQPKTMVYQGTVYKAAQILLTLLEGENEK